MKTSIILKNGCEIRIVGVIKGLSSERDRIKSEFESRPDFVAMSISPEELKGLRTYSRQELDDEIYLSDYEEIYAEKLKKWGDVEVPPPCYVEALKISNSEKIQVGALDMDEILFTNAYCAYVGSSDLLRHSLRKGLVQNKKFKAKTAEEFVLEWDKRVNSLKGFRRLEEKREQYMAKRLTDVSSNFKNVLAFIEIERANGVATKLQNTDPDS